MLLKCWILQMLFLTSHAFWDLGTTTPHPARDDKTLRQSFFRWQRAERFNLMAFFPYWDWHDMTNRHRLAMVVGISIDMIPLSTGALLNERVVLTAANFLAPLIPRQRDLRIWALGPHGTHISPYRYRVWRVWRIFPPSNNPEHQHGPRGDHVPRHDLAIIFTLDQIFLKDTFQKHLMWAVRSYLPGSHWTLDVPRFPCRDMILFAGSGFEYMTHVRENYKIFFAIVDKKDIVDCSKYLPKWWGKFICIKNVKRFSGVQNGGPLLVGDYVYGLGCFEIRYNEDRILVFTDIRYYVKWIRKVGYIWRYQYYEYAYQQWNIGYRPLDFMNLFNLNEPYPPGLNRKPVTLWVLG